MNLSHLSLFHAVATHGNVSRAAEHLLISQPAISKQLKELERALGATLFDRLPKGMRLTPSGELLAGYASRIFALEAEAEQAMAELQGLRRGRLVVGASTTIGVYLLPDVFVRFRRQYPGILLQLEIAHSDVILRWLRRGDIHLAFAESRVEADDVTPEPFAQDRLIAIAARGHPLARRRSITPAALCREPFVVRETGSGTKSLVERALADRGLKITPAMSLASTEAIKRAVAAGVGVAIVSAMAVALELQAGSLLRLRVSGLDLERPLYRLLPRNAHDAPAGAAFMDMVRDAITSVTWSPAVNPRPPTL